MNIRENGLLYRLATRYGNYTLGGQNNFCSFSKNVLIGFVHLCGIIAVVSIMLFPLIHIFSWLIVMYQVGYYFEPSPEIIVTGFIVVIVGGFIIIFIGAGLTLDCLSHLLYKIDHQTEKPTGTTEIIFSVIKMIKDKVCVKIKFV